jgi:uncharacterized Zn finger protein
MNIKNFEKHIDVTILDRGFDYYVNDYIQELDVVGVGEFSALVEGTEDYEVFIRLDARLAVVEHNCSCPYDWGPVCKHEVAVLYHIKDSELYAKPIGESKIGLIKQSLEGKSKDEIIDVLLELAKRNREAKEELSWALGLDKH